MVRVGALRLDLPAGIERERYSHVDPRGEPRVKPGLRLLDGQLARGDVLLGYLRQPLGQQSVVVCLVDAEGHKAALRFFVRTRSTGCEAARAGLVPRSPEVVEQLA